MCLLHESLLFCEEGDCKTCCQWGIVDGKRRHHLFYTAVFSYFCTSLSLYLCNGQMCTYDLCIYTYMYFSKGGMAEGSGNSFTQVFFSLHTQSVLPALPPHLFTFLTVSPKISLFKENMQVSKIWLTVNNVLLFFDLLFSRNITRSFLSHTYQTTFLSHCYFQVHFPPPCSHSYFFPSSPSARPVRELAPNWSWFPGHGEGQWEKVNGKCHVSQASRRHTPNSALIGFFLADSHYQD